MDPHVLVCTAYGRQTDRYRRVFRVLTKSKLAVMCLNFQDFGLSPSQIHGWVMLRRDIKIANELGLGNNNTRVRRRAFTLTTHDGPPKLSRTLSIKLWQVARHPKRLDFQMGHIDHWIGYKDSVMLSTCLFWQWHNVLVCLLACVSSKNSLGFEPPPSFCSNLGAIRSILNDSFGRRARFVCV